MNTIIAAQGEVNIRRISAIPADAVVKPVARAGKGYIIAHSENGNHHLLTGGEVLERTDNVPTGMRIFYAILSQPEALIQDSPHPHASIPLAPGIIELRTSREFDPFADQARRVAD